MSGNRIDAPRQERSPAAGRRPRRWWRAAAIGVAVVALAALVVRRDAGGQRVEATASPRTHAEPEAPPGGEAPAGMVYVPGGVTRIGSEEGLPDERPVFMATVRPFFMDAHPVTVGEFRAFVQATQYRTEAERFGSAGVFDVDGRAWRLVEGASWRHPLGPDAAAAADDHPVTQVSWHDAAAYAAWAGKRLPSEIEWEHAARNARDSRTSFAWGDSLVDHGVHKANTWQGRFPDRNTAEDGYAYTSPVGAFGRTPLGLTDMAGNVWEWTDDWYRPYGERGRAFTPAPGSEKALRGGSFLCSDNFCAGYRVSARSHSTPDTSLFHTGFRCAMDVPPPRAN